MRPAGRKSHGATRTEDSHVSGKYFANFPIAVSDEKGSSTKETVGLDVKALEKMSMFSGIYEGKFQCSLKRECKVSESARRGASWTRFAR